jgi:putative ABC transport system permease protein
MLIILMLADQKSHDQFNVNKDRIYRILSDGPDFRNPYATSPSPLAAVLQKDYPVVQTSTRLEMGVGGDGTCVVLVLGLVTIGSQTIRASRRNPVDSLKAD